MQDSNIREEGRGDRPTPRSQEPGAEAAGRNGRLALARHGRVDRATVVLALRHCLRGTLACLERSKLHHYAYMQLGTDPEAATFAAICLEHTTEEHGHAARLAERIEELGGTAELEFDARDRSHPESSNGTTDLAAMIRADLAAGRTAVGVLETAIENLAEHDPASLRVLEAVCAAEQRHVDALGQLLGLQLA